MSLNHSPQIVTNGLVFYYDQGNTTKSWKGKPITNYYGDITTTSNIRPNRTAHFWNGYDWIVDSTYTHPGVDGPSGVFLGIVYKHTSGALNSTWSGNSYGYVLKDIASTIGNTYSMSSYVYMSTDCDLAIPCSTEGATTNNIDIAGYSNTYNTNYKGTWQRIARSAVSDGNVRWLPNYPQKTGVTDGSFNGFYMWGGVQVEDGSTVSPYVGTNYSTAYTRSNTQALLDLTGNNTITASSLTYASDNTFSFNGSSNTMDCGNPAALSAIAGTSNVSVEAWVNLSGYGSSSYGVITHKGYPWTWLMENPSNTMRIRFYLSNSGDVACPDSSTHALNTWYHFIGTYDGSYMRFYRNGVLTNSVAGSGTLGGAGSNHVIGSYSGAYFSQGKIPIVKIYNRTLSASEVKQNFNALRSRYGI